MLTVHILQSVIGDTQRQTVRFHGPHDNPPQTVAAAIAKLAPESWRGCASAWLNDRPAGHDLELRDGDRLIIAPRVMGPALLPLAAGLVGLGPIGQVVGVLAVSEAYKLILPPPVPTIEAGDLRSPTYAWDGIRTNYGTGFGLPVAYGRHALGGQVISAAVSGVAGGEKEVLDMTLLLSEGRCHSIGTGANKVYGDIAGEANFIGNLFGAGPPIPTGLKANGNLLVDAQTKLWVRLGEPGQTLMPSVPGPAKTDEVQEPLDEDGAEIIHTVNESEVGGFASIKLVFPAGLYELDGSGNQRTFAVTFRTSYRRQGETAWKFQPGGDAIIGNDIPRDFRFSAFTGSQVFTNTLGGPWEVRVQRLSSQGSGGTPVDNCVLSQVIYYSAFSQSYPGSAVINIRTIASETLSGGNPNWHIVGEWRRVRVYDDIEGLSDDEYWDMPTAAPYAGIWSYPPGRNPAWVCTDAITSGRYGLGKFYTHADLDLEAFRDWADLCDETVTGPNGPEARYTFDGPCDNSAASGWDEIQRIARCGRATIKVERGRLTPKFEWRDAFGRGTNSVPARVRQFLLTDANQDVEVSIGYLNVRERPTVIDVQFLNEDLDYEQDLLSVEDPNAEDLNAPWKLGAQSIRRETENLMGCTRPSQARRHALYRHEQNRLGKTTFTARASLEHLGMAVGDIVGYQCSTFRPYAQATYGHRATVSGVRTGAGGIVLDGAVTIDATGQFLVVDVDGAVQTRTITNGAGTYAAGVTLTFSGADVELPEAAPVAVGYGGEVVRDYVITSVAVDQDLMRVVEGVEWVPSAHDDDAVPPGGPGDPELDPGSDAASTPLAPPGAFPEVVSVAAYDTVPGASTLAIERPDGFRGRRARLYARKSGSGAALAYLGQTEADRIQVPRLAPHVPHDIAVVYDDAQGHFAAPDATVTVTPGEFPGDAVPAVPNLTAAVVPDGVLLQWDPLDGVDYYEVRRSDGLHWCGAEVVGKTRSESLLVTDVGVGTADYLVRARTVGGLYSSTFASVQVTSTAPQNAVAHATTIAIDDGSGSGCDYNGTDVRIELDAGEYDGTWTCDELDLTEAADYLWLAHVLYHWIDAGTLVDDLTFGVGSGEAAWWTVDGREPTPSIPGADFALEVDTATAMVEDYDYVPATTGQHARVDVEVRYYNGSWSGWLPYRARRWIASKAQLRVRLRRWSLAYEPYVTQLNMRAAYGDGTRL